MRRQIRRGVFETNSSSMHSLVVMKRDQYYTRDEVESCVYVNKDGYISVWDNDEYFGRSPFRVLTTLEDKSLYVVASTARNGKMDNEVYETVCNVMRSYIPNFKGFSYRDSPHTYIGVDEDILTPFLQEEQITIEEFLINKKYRVIVDGDEYCIYSDMKKAGMINTAKIEKEYPRYKWAEED